MRPSEEAWIVKRNHLTALAARRDQYRKTPKLTWLFFEITSQCNLRCRHCGSRCENVGTELAVEDIQKTLGMLDVSSAPMICLTGGEPLMHPHFREIVSVVSEQGFFWGMTTNATLITPETVELLRKKQMSSVSVSLDGLEQVHDALRMSAGAWKKAVNGIRLLIDAGFSPQVTTVVHSGNILDIEQLYKVLCDLGVQNWRLVNVDPIGRACETNELLLNRAGFKWLINYIQEKRYDPGCMMKITYGCSHYLGVEKERMVRDQYFMCGAGLFIASVRSNGDICACLDIENRPELVQGNIHQDNLIHVWNHRFEFFRQDRTANSEICRKCKDRLICGGDSAHTWDYDRQEPKLCGMMIMEDPL